MSPWTEVKKLINRSYLKQQSLPVFACICICINTVVVDIIMIIVMAKQHLFKAARSFLYISYLELQVDVLSTNKLSSYTVSSILIQYK